MSESVLVDDEHPIDPDDELLVAYLDGELSDDERSSVERRLVGEEAFRKRLQSLQTGWEWLEELPNETTNEKLVESTIELVVSDIAPSPAPQESWFARNRKRVLGVSILVTSFLAGVVGTAVARRVHLRHELEELEIAENHEAYKLGTNFAFFRELSYNDRWQQMIQAMEKIGGQEMTTPSVVASIPVSERKEALRTLPDSARSKLDARWNTYLGFSDETKHRLKETADRVASADDGEQLLTTMKAAAIWLEGLSDELRDRMMSEDKDVRKAAIDEAIGLTMAELSRDSGKLISDDTANRIYLYLQLLLAQRLEASPRNQQLIDELSARGVRREFVEFGLMLSMVSDRGRGDSRRRFGMSWGGPRFFSPGFSFGGSRGPGGPGSDGPGSGGPSSGGPGAQRPPGPGPDGPPSQPISPSSVGVAPRGAPGPDGERPPNGEPPRPPQFPRIPKLSEGEILSIRDVLSVQALEDLETFKTLRSMKDLQAGAGVGEGMIEEYAVIDTLRSWSIEAILRNTPRPESNPIERYRAHEERDTLDLLEPDRILDEVYWDRWGGSSRRSR